MSNSYLDIAELVIRRARRPLSPSEILALAYLEHIVPAHLHGQTQEKTLQARLSEDISRLRENSLFFRTNRARFFLREFLTDLDVPEKIKVEYFARPRRKDLKSERILTFEFEMNSLKKRRILSRHDLDDLFSSEKYRYSNWIEVKDNINALPVYSFVIFYRKNELLIHTIGRYKERSHPSNGMKSVGLGSVVRVQDSDLLYDAYHGIIGSGINELVYSLGLPRELARVARYENKVILHCGIVEEDLQIGRHIRAIMTYECPNNFSISKASLSLNSLSWARIDDIFFTDQFDGVSQYLLSSGLITKISGLS